MTAIDSQRHYCMKAASIWCPPEQSSASMRQMGKRSSRAELPVELQADRVRQVDQAAQVDQARVDLADLANRLREHPAGQEHLAVREHLVALVVPAAPADLVAVVVEEEAVGAWAERIIRHQFWVTARSSTSHAVAKFM